MQQEGQVQTTRTASERSRTGPKVTFVYSVVGDESAYPLNITLLKEFKIQNAALVFGCEEFGVVVSPLC